MKLIKSLTLSELHDALPSLIEKKVNELKKEKRNKKKILEVCHVGKFLALLGNNSIIEQLSERPDFIINIAGNSVGLEHQIIVDDSVKRYEGFFESVLSIAEAELQRENDLPDFLADCYLYSDIKFRSSNKTEFVKIVKMVVKHHLSTGSLLNNNLIEDISTMPHSQKSLTANFGFWWQKAITPELILAAITEKERKHASYVKNTGCAQWLLLVVGSLQDSSYEVQYEFPLVVSSQFSKVYLMEDFRARLFEIK